MVSNGPDTPEDTVFLIILITALVAGLPFAAAHLPAPRRHTAAHAEAAAHHRRTVAALAR